VTVALIAVLENVPAIVSVCVSAPAVTAFGIVENAPFRCTVPLYEVPACVSVSVVAPVVWVTVVGFPCTVMLGHVLCVTETFVATSRRLSAPSPAE